VRGAVAPEAIGDEAAGDTAAPLEERAKEPDCSVAVSPGLEQDIDDHTVLVDGPPEVLTPTANRHEELVQVHVSPTVATRCRSRRAYARPNVSHQCRMDSYETVIPRWARRSSTSRKLRVKR
jgi:hypothetical protein